MNTWGEYKHFKRKKYIAYCIAETLDGRQYVLYQQQYDDKSFWIRPHEMFFEKVVVNEKELLRFSKTRNKALTWDDSVALDNLAKLLIDRPIILKYSEDSNMLYSVYNISEKNKCAYVTLVDDNNYGAYLTDYQIARRAGYDLFCCYGKRYIRPLPPKVKKFSEQQSFIIEGKAVTLTSIPAHGNHIDITADILQEHLNACSVDLRIADAEKDINFLYSNKKFVDLVTLNNMPSAKTLWKPIRLKTDRSTNAKYLIIRPHESIITHVHERIRIPNDCAGKIEIRSTYARLSLSVTSGDFCNPGYNGYYPLVIRNDGNHTIALHPLEPMLQLILIKLEGPIVKEYPKHSTYKNLDGIDDGSPYLFWEVNTAKRMRKNVGYSDIEIIAEKTQRLLTGEQKDRFSNTFIAFCSNRARLSKYQLSSEPSEKHFNIERLWDDYKNREKVLDAFFSHKIVEFIITFFSIAAAIALWMFPSLFIEISGLWPKIIVTFCFLIIPIISWILIARLKPTTFCTLKDITYKNIEL